MAKSAGAFRTIGELSDELGLPQHVLRYWETRFPQLKPLQRAGGRRYYRTEDIALVRRIQELLGPQGYTVRGVQKLLEEGGDRVPASAPLPSFGSADPAGAETPMPVDTAALRAIRDRLAAALAADEG